ncbi:MAG TPA: OB-fold domain-containing protein [Candidatus Thermoplasmatota archaeon]|nr:OB-fold domain-containing protein [Candidatus Thermoplasmatota archaeon]
MIAGAWCPRCAHGFVGERERCPVCAGNVEPRTLNPEGILETYTTVHAPPHGFEAGFTVGVILLAGGVRAAAHWTGQGVLAMGVRVSVRREGDLLRFELVPAA